MGGESITLTITENITAHKRFNLKLKVLFEDDYLAVIDKPAGVLVSGNHFKTITNTIVQNLKPSTKTDAIKPQPVHRLDFGTTGVLLVGKTNSTIRTLNKQFENKEIEKTYFAITIGKMVKEGIIISNVDNKPSKSIYKVEKTVLSKRFDNLNLVKLKPLTGRRHQLRIHLSNIGNPILGDKVYGIEDLILNGKGIYLHAYSLKFKHPFSQENVYLRSDLPEKFTKIFGN